MRTEINSRKPFVRSCRDEGFSLVELMVAVGIMGSLSVMAVPAYGRYQVKAAQAEAKTTLASIHTAQELYFTEENAYAGSQKTTNYPAVTESTLKQTIGITISEDSKYKCPTNCLDKATSPASNKYKAILVSREILAGCATKKDKWCLDQDKEMKNDSTASTSGACADTDSESGDCS